MDMIKELRDKVGTVCLVGRSAPVKMAVTGVEVAENLQHEIRFFFRVQDPCYDFDEEFGYRLVPAEDCWFFLPDEPTVEVSHD